MTFNRKKIMRNYWAARLCHGCKYLHVGRKVDHNHCDCKFGDTHWQDKRANGHFNHPDTYDHGIDCSNKETI